MQIRIDLNEPQIIQKVTSDKFGLLVSNEWKRLIDPYTPRDNGILENSTRIRPFEIEYIQKYCKPQLNLNYAGKYKKKNPYATDHWDIKAAEAGQTDKLYQTINDALKNNRV